MSSDLEARVGAGFQAMASGDWAGARDEFVAVLEVDEVPEALLGLANASYWLGDLEKLLESYERVYAADVVGPIPCWQPRPRNRCLGATRPPPSRS